MTSMCCGPEHHLAPPGLLQQPTPLSCLLLHSPAIDFNSAASDPLKYKSDHVTSLLKISQQLNINRVNARVLKKPTGPQMIPTPPVTFSTFLLCFVSLLLTLFHRPYYSINSPSMFTVSGFCSSLCLHAFPSDNHLALYLLSSLCSTVRSSKIFLFKIATPPPHPHHSSHPFSA